MSEYILFDVNSLSGYPSSPQTETSMYVSVCQDPGNVRGRLRGWTLNTTEAGVNRGTLTTPELLSSSVSRRTTDTRIHTQNDCRFRRNEGETMTQEEEGGSRRRNVCWIQKTENVPGATVYLEVGTRPRRVRDLLLRTSKDSI